jgi:hypothetical protein
MPILYDFARQEILQERGDKNDCHMVDISTVISLASYFLRSLEVNLGSDIEIKQVQQTFLPALTHLTLLYNVGKRE